MVRNGSSEIVLRDLSGKEVSVAKSQIDVLEKIPGSLMPPGLTAGLEKQEFINLVGFLSKLGESGQLRVPNERFVRRWETALNNKDLSKKISNEGLGHIVKGNSKMLFQPIYSKVSGDLPVEELPVVEVNSNKRYSFVRFEVEVLSSGNVKLLFNSTEGITGWVNQEQLKLSGQVMVDLPIGMHQITLAINRVIHQKGSLNIQLQDAEISPTQTRLIMGQ